MQDKNSIKEPSNYPTLKPSRCLECGDELHYGRADRKFCSVKCKNSYNNKRKSRLDAFKAKTHGQLDKNYNILKRLMDGGCSEVSLTEALLMGMNPYVVTMCVRQGKVTSLCCYDICYRISESKIFKIERISVNLQQKFNFSI